MKKLLYIGHAYHNKTASTAFLKEILEKKYRVDFFDFDPYSDDIQTHFAPLKNKHYDVLVLFQIMPHLNELKKQLSFNKSIFFPMYDGAPDRKNPIWAEYTDTQIINFSSTLHKELLNLGFSSKYIQFFPKPQHFEEWGAEDSVFFWNRVQQVNINTLTAVMDASEMKHIHIHKAMDPGHNFAAPPDKLKEKITYSEWFDSKAEMQKQILRSAFYMAPRKYEGIGMSFLEAMAMGRCVISPDNPTMNEYITHGQNGLLYNPDKPAKLTPGNIRQIQKNALEFTEKGFKKWEASKHLILDWLEEPLIKNDTTLKNFLRDISFCDTRGYLFSFIPLYKIRENHENTKIKHYIFGIPWLKIKRDTSQKTKYYFLGILLYKKVTDKTL